MNAFPESPKTGKGSVSANLMRLIALFGVLSVFSMPAAGTPLGIADVEIAPPVAAQRADSNIRAQIASSSRGWLVVWENRGLRGGGQSEIQGMFVNKNGTPGSPFSFSLTGPKDYPVRCEEAAVTAAGDGFVIAWTEINTAGETYHARIAACTLNPEGKMDRSPRYITEEATLSRFPRVASSGSLILVSWLNDIQLDHTLEIQGRMLSHDLAPLGGPYNISPPGVAQQQGNLVFSGNSFLSTWIAAPAVGGASSAQGAVLSPTGVVEKYISISAAGSENYLSTVPLGSGFLAVWHDFSLSFGTGAGVFGAIKAARITGDGQVLDNPPLTVRRNDNNDPVVFTRGSGNFSHALISWTESHKESAQSHLETRIVRPDGSMTEPAGDPVLEEDFQIYDAQSSPCPEAWLLAYSRPLPVPFNGQWISGMFVRRLNADGGPSGAETPVSLSSNRMQALALSELKDGFVAVWQDDRNERDNEWDIYARRFKKDGTPLDAVPILVGGGVEDQGSPSVAGLDDVWAVAWRTDLPGRSRIEAKVMRGGTAVSETKILDEGADNLPKAPAIAAGANGFLAVWVGRANDPVEDPFHAIRGTHLSPEGNAGTPGGFVVSLKAGRHQQAPAVAGNSSGYYAAWTSNAGGNGSAAALLGRLLPGQPAQPLGSAISVISNSDTPRGVDIAAHDPNYLVVWRAGHDVDRIEGVRISSEGGILRTPVLLADPASFGPLLKEPAVAPSGDGWVLGWLTDRRLCGRRISDDEALTAHPVFEPHPPVAPFTWDLDTLSCAVLGGRILFGVVEEGVHRASAVLTVPGEKVPSLRIALLLGSWVHVTVDPSPYFPINPQKLEMSATGTDWRPVASLPKGSYWLSPEGGILVKAEVPSLFFRLRASLDQE
ncbi:MAG: putative lipoprotein [Verrucomicrobiales bacterium]|nr:putative lipoprotein [Verrucomicrobiales bacterium]